MKDKIIIILIILLLASGATAGIYRNNAIKVQAELIRRDQEDRIDAPYKEALEESERKRQELQNKLVEKRQEILKRVAVIEEYKDQISELDNSYRKLLNNSPDENIIKERYKDADIERICSDFAAMDIPCEAISR